MSDERHEGEREFDLLDRIDLLIATLPPGDAVRRELLDLRMEICQREEVFIEARQTIEKLEEVIKKVTSPANRIGTFLGNVGKDTAHIVVGGADYYCNVDPRIPIAKLKKGTRVLVNEAFVIVGDLGFEPAGPVTKITEVIGTDRLRVGNEHGTQSLVLQRSAQLTKTALKQGDEVRVDSNYRMALEMMSAPGSHEHYLDNVPELPWSKVGGQERAIEAIKDAIELPLLHPHLFEKFHHATPKGFLLYGPPGCGKTLIGKATAYNLTRQLREKAAEKDVREYFMHVKGPEILNMWVGESERMVREIFATAREKRREGFMPFLFIDEAESILGTRRASRYSNILSTLVPMFCSEMDGIDSLNDVVIILASNRADLIGVAIVASVVERAKGMAIKRAIASQRAFADSSVAGVADPEFSGITEQDLQISFQAEYAENDIFPPTDITEDWLKLIDYDPEYVVKIAPVRPNTAQRGANLGGVI